MKKIFALCLMAGLIFGCTKQPDTIETNKLSLWYDEPAEWTQIKVYVKTSTEEDGIIKIWINGGNNGNPTFSYSGRTLLKGNGSYTKIGHYGQIYNLKTSYFDNVHITKEINTSFSEWVKND